MKICVNMTYYMEVDDPVFETLHELHWADKDGTPEQYKDAVSIIEKMTGVKFFDIEHDEIENTELRVTDVYCAEDYVPILEA